MNLSTKLFSHPLRIFLSSFLLIAQLGATSIYPHDSCKVVVVMADEIVVDKDVFYDRLSSFLTQWKGDKRSDEIFQGVGSIVLCVGKASEGAYTKATAFQVWTYTDLSLLMLTVITAMAPWI